MHTLWPLNAGPQCRTSTTDSFGVALALFPQTPVPDSLMYSLFRNLLSLNL